VGVKSFRRAAAAIKEPRKGDAGSKGFLRRLVPGLLRQETKT